MIIMTEMILNYKEDESIGKIASVDTGTAIAFIFDDKNMSELQINQLIAVNSPRAGTHIIGMVVKMSRRIDEKVLQNDIDFEHEDNNDVDITKGDLVIMQTVYTVVDNISDTIFEEDGEVSENEMPPMRDFSEMSTDELSDLIDQLNAGIQVIDAVAPASQFGDVQIADILGDLLESLSKSEEGSN